MSRPTSGEDRRWEMSAGEPADAAAAAAPAEPAPDPAPRPEDQAARRHPWRRFHHHASES